MRKHHSIRDEAAGVTGPALEDRQVVELRDFDDFLRDRGTDGLRPHRESLWKEMLGLPEALEAWWIDFLNCSIEVEPDLGRLTSERRFDALHAAEEIHQQRRGRALGILEQQ